MKFEIRIHMTPNTENGAKRYFWEIGYTLLTKDFNVVDSDYADTPEEAFSAANDIFLKYHAMFAN